MENPGLKRLTPDEPFIKVTHRRLAAPPPMATPYTGQGTNGGQVVPNEPPTVRSNPMNPPPLAATPVTPGPNATNGAPPILRLNDVASTPRMGDPATQAANQRRKTVQQGDGTKENPAYDAAQRRVQDQLERRRTHALHQGAALDWDDDEFWNGSDYPQAERCPNCGSSDVDGQPGNSYCYDCGHVDNPREDFGPLKTRDFSPWDQATVYGDHGKPGMEKAYPGSGKKILDEIRRGPGNVPPLDMQHLNSVKTADRVQQYREIPGIDTWLDSDFPPHGTGALRPMIEWKDDVENPHFEKSTT